MGTKETGQPSPKGFGVSGRGRSLSPCLVGKPMSGGRRDPGDRRLGVNRLQPPACGLSPLLPCSQKNRLALLRSN